MDQAISLDPSAQSLMALGGLISPGFEAKGAKGESCVSPSH